MFQFLKPKQSNVKIITLFRLILHISGYICGNVPPFAITFTLTIVYILLLLPIYSDNATVATTKLNLLPLNVAIQTKLPLSIYVECCTINLYK